MFKLRAWLSVLLLAAPASAAAGEIVFRVDPAASEAKFTLKATMHTARGVAQVKAGEVRLDLAAGTVAGRIVVDAATANTANEGRDEKMHKEVLESARFPEIAFSPQKIEGVINPAGRSDVKASGVFLLHGQEHEITIPLRVTIENGRAEATGSFSIPYVAWGLKDPSVFVLRVAKEVQVQIKIVATVSET